MNVVFVVFERLLFALFEVVDFTLRFRAFEVRCPVDGDDDMSPLLIERVIRRNMNVVVVVVVV